MTLAGSRKQGVKPRNERCGSALDGGRAFVQGRTDYREDSRSYDNLWIIQLTGDGRATAFTVWYMPRT